MLPRSQWIVAIPAKREPSTKTFLFLLRCTLRRTICRTSRNFELHRTSCSALSLSLPPFSFLVSLDSSNARDAFLLFVASEVRKDTSFFIYTTLFIFVLSFDVSALSLDLVESSKTCHSPRVSRRDLSL